jgi:FtsP/CotA-like multicopper oxidase with cupredoxin domain
MVDNHRLEITSLDGNDVTPFVVDSFYVGPAERVDFRILENVSGLNSVWMRAEVERMYNRSSPVEYKGGLAIISSQSRDTAVEPISQKAVCSASIKCLVFNCPWQQYGPSRNEICVPLTEVKSIKSKTELDNEFGLNDPDVEEIFVNVAFQIGSSVNGRRYVAPRLPLMEGAEAAMTSCDEVECQQGCYCTTVIDIPYGKTVDLIMSSMEAEYFGNHHAMHLHGHDFAVLKIGYPEYHNETGHWTKANSDISCNHLCTNPTWSPEKQTNDVRKPANDVTTRPVIKDTIMVPAYGYVVVRFKAINPGYWLFHCHQESHHMEGMAALFRVGVDKIPQLPPRFPRCGDFNWTKQVRATILCEQVL